MTRPVLTEITESIGEVLSTSTGVLTDVAATAASRTGDLASAALEHVGAPPGRRSRTPWLLLVLALAAVIAVGVVAAPRAGGDVRGAVR